MFDLETTDRLLTTTRAVRKRLDLDRPVEPEVILECLRLALQAPTGGNRQRWRWVVVTDPGKRAQLAELYTGIGRPVLTAAAEAVPVEDRQTTRVYSSAIHLLDVLDRVPVIVIPCMEGRIDGADHTTTAGFYGSILPAVWSFMLALRSRGLGSAWTTLYLRREQDAARILDLPEDFTQVALLPVAYTIGDDFKAATRTPVEEVTLWR